MSRWRDYSRTETHALCCCWRSSLESLWRYIFCRPRQLCTSAPFRRVEARRETSQQREEVYLAAPLLLPPPLHQVQTLAGLLRRWAVRFFTLHPPTTTTHTQSFFFLHLTQLFIAQYLYQTCGSIFFCAHSLPHSIPPVCLLRCGRPLCKLYKER